jgi:hypothetical protein
VLFVKPRKSEILLVRDIEKGLYMKLSEFGEFFLQACHSREGGNPDFFCKRGWMPA